MPQPPFYQDWQFWSAAVALLALALSQLPPVHVLVRRAKLKCEVYSRIFITHTVGNPNSQWHLIIENSGGRAIRVKTISIRFMRRGGQPFAVPAQNYLATPDAKETVLFTPFRLRPGEEWAHIVNFYEFFSREEDKSISNFKIAMRNDIVAKKKLSDDEEMMVEVDPRIVKPVTAFFESHFRWLPGEYDATLSVITDREEANLTQSYRFTLFESESTELQSYADDYKFGGGLLFNSQRHAGVLVPIHEN